MAFSIQDIADRVGVSKASVSLYLKDQETRRVGADTKTRIQKTIEDLGYRPNAMARALSSAKTHIIGIMIPYNGPVFRSTFADELLSGIQSVLYPRGYSMLFMPTKGTNSRDMVRNQLDTGLGYDGYILFGTRFCTRDDMQHNADLMLQAGVPFAVVNMPAIDLPINQVTVADSPETDVTDYFLRNGHRDIVLMAGREDAPESDSAIAGYRAALKRVEVPFRDDLVVFGNYERDVSRSQLLAVIERGVAFSAVYALSDTMAAGAYEALADTGLSIPDDVSIVGRNDSFFANLMNPPLTTVRRPIFDVGTRSAECLLRTINGATDTRKIVLKASLIQRMSSAPNHNSGFQPLGV